MQKNMYKKLGIQFFVTVFMLVFFFFFPVFAEEKESVNIKADYVYYAAAKTYARGHVSALYKNTLIEADKLEIDNINKNLYATGNVVITKGNNRIAGDSIVYSLISQKAVLDNATGKTRDINFKNTPIKEDLLFWGDRVVWENNVLSIYNGEATTCNYPQPKTHYEIKSELITVIPGDKMVAKNSSLYFHQNKLFTIGTMVYSLREGSTGRINQNLIPRMGYNEVDGWYAKEGYNYLLGKRDYGTLLLDVYEKTGTGKGVSHNFYIGETITGAIYYYNMISKLDNANRRDFSNRVNIKLPGNMGLNWDIQNKYYQYPGRKTDPTFTGTFQFSKTGEKYNLNLSKNANETGSNGNGNYNMNYNYRVSSSLNASLAVDYTENKSQWSKTSSFHPLFKLIDNGKLFDTEFTIEKTEGDVVSYRNREPELSFRSKGIQFGEFPLQSTFTFARILEEPKGLKKMRGDLLFNLPDKVWIINGKHRFTVGMGYRQILIDTGEAKYQTTGRAGFLTQFGPHVAARVDYNMQHWEGYSPFQFDTFSRTSQLTGQLQLYNKDYWRINLATTHDLYTKMYQNMSVRIMVHPFEKWTFNFTTNYNLHGLSWQNVDSQLNMQLSPTVNVQYWNVYDIKNQKIVYQDFALVKDLHCWEAKLVYRGQQNEIWFSIGLKAFPTDSLTIGANKDGPVLPQDWWRQYQSYL